VYPSWKKMMMGYHFQSRIVSASSSGPRVDTAQNLDTEFLVPDIPLNAATMSAIAWVCAL
jgi:hypothetical protein